MRVFLVDVNGLEPLTLRTSRDVLSQSVDYVKVKGIDKNLIITGIFAVYFKERLYPNYRFTHPVTNIYVVQVSYKYAFDNFQHLPFLYTLSAL